MDIDPTTLPSFSKERTDYIAQFDVERWYHAFQKHTPLTQTIPLPISVAQTLVQRYRKRFGIGKHDHVVPEIDSELFQSLDRAIKSMKMGAFVRLSTRSPKDASLDEKDPSVLDALEIELRGCNSPCETVNEALAVAFDAANRALRCESATDAFHLLERSERAYSDLLHALDVEAWSMLLIVRQWDERIKLRHEFRCFIVEGVLTALSQYNTYVFDPTLANEMDEMVSACLGRWKLITEDPVSREYVHSIRAFVADFAVIGPGDAVLIELNPFAAGTGPGLFDYGRDRALLLGGKEPWGSSAAQVQARDGEWTEGDVRQRVIHGVVCRDLCRPPEAMREWEHVTQLIPLVRVVKERMGVAGRGCEVC